ncbi:hypothetical protein FHS32_004609 [Streptomyces albaduncus]|uniref:Uncharacterized protein n=1 Tax=Streptomyces griseoloalbus TaxID=67303 RepID=A0A7W8BSY2_9ACTN|nr:hypothetical protein [Streptomyces albaduncus]
MVELTLRTGPVTAPPRRSPSRSACPTPDTPCRARGRSS